MSAIELRGFSWRHGGRAAHAVRDVDLRVEHGERVLLLGASGAGKSTLLAACAGLLAADSGEQHGEVLIDGVDAKERRDRVGILFQDPESQLVMARSGDDVAFGLENRGVPTADIWPMVDKALSSVGFEYPLEHSTHALSGGEQQRLALAGVLASEPEVLLLDEPTANLDPLGAAAVRDGLSRVLQGRDTTLVLVEHRVGEVLGLVDRVVVLEPGGGIRADGTPERVFAEHGASLAAQGVWVPEPWSEPARPGARRAGGPAPGDPRLRAIGVGLRYPDTARPALSGVDVELRDGELLAVTGANGSGKSTLALLLGGLLAPTAGRIRVRGGPSARPPHRWRAPALARQIGSVFQDPEHQFVTSRVDEELALGPRAAGMSDAEVDARVSELLERLRLSRLARANPFTLSGGEARRLSVATALSCAPRILVLDEPTFGQDRRTWTELVDLIAGLRDDGHAIAVVTHDTDFTAALADRTLVMRRGRTC